MKKILYIDLDGVVADFDGAIRRLYPEIDLLRPDLKDKRIDEILENQHHIFEHLKPLPEAVHSVTILMEYYDVYFLSTAPWIAEYSGSDKRIWVEKMFGDLAKKKLILTHRKDLCIGDYLIDDRLKNGAGEFTGELLHFGPGNDFPNWETVMSYLMPEAIEQMELGGPVSKEEENESRITKTQINDVIQGKSKVSHGTAIHAAASYLRRSQGTSSLAEREQGRQVNEKNSLRKYINDNRLWLLTDKLGPHLVSGAEQKVYFKGGKYVIKLNDANFYDFVWEDYLNSLLLHNLFFPDTAYELIGFAEIEKTLYSVVRQPYIKANSRTNLAQVKKQMAENGFENNRREDYYNPELGLILEDLHDENVLTKDGVLYYIDTVFYIREKSQMKHRQMDKGGKTEEKPKEMSNVKELIEKVRIAAEKELEHCNGVDTPAVCQLINDAKGKNMVLDQICEYVGKNGMTIGEAINYIERTNNPELSNY